ncbi:type II toxin-antitoxin system RelE/ParE family toxin [Aestuariibacter salexigens]|uniref:type II toxin-antitoxin system RelE/ParE family toxin n=1 Tax=Aestuariibacter salexigens TaxID=226010 RepID=UPI00047B3E5D|nr:type II toxin-antitoxin system RelE/ParE family toxin [Aestuariibacter salexigens]
MSEYRISKAASKDLFQIGLYTEAEWGRDKRNEYLDSLEQRFIELASNTSSALARPRDDIKAGCFSSSVNRHIIIFRKFDYGIRVIRVLHQSMDFTRHVR